MSGASYTLCGFGSGVDFRPVKFKEPPPSVRICGMCGIVPGKIAVLPCSHLLCESCLRGCADGDASVCPMDEESFHVEADVCWITPSWRHLSKMQVFCWNTENGCEFVGPAEKLLEHFEQDCGFHTISCPRCRDTVLRKDVPRHCKAGCRTLKQHTVPEGEEGAFSRNKTVSSEKASTSYQDIFASLESGVNELVEKLKKLISLGLSSIKEHCEAGVAEEKLLEVTETLHKLLNKARRSHFSVNFPGSLVEAPTFGITREVTTKESTEDCVVLTWDSWDNLNSFDDNNVKADTFTVCLEDKVTNVEIQVLVFCKAEFVCVSAKLTEPGRWGLPDIEPLSSSQLRRTYLRGVVYRDMKRTDNLATCLQQGYLVRCIWKPPSNFFEDKYSTKRFSFLVRMNLCDTGNS